MKKLFALLTVCGFAFAFVACGGGASQEEAADSTAVETAPAVEAAPADTTAAADSTAAQ
ncbi:MAG: hypothetical protein ACO3FI_03890 [Cyclobacteriaceae bacterium]